MRHTSYLQRLRYKPERTALDVNDMDLPGRRKRPVALVQVCGIYEASGFALKRTSPTGDMTEDMEARLLLSNRIKQFCASQMSFAWNCLIENAQRRTVGNQHVEIIGN